MITIVVGNTQCKIMGLNNDVIIKEFDKQMGYQVPGRQFMKNVNHGWDGRIRLFKHQTFPVGLLYLAEKILRLNGVKYQVQDNRESFRGDPMPIGKAFVPRDYQNEIVERSIEAGSGIIRVATGGGKSLILAMIAAEYNVPSVIYVIGIELLYQIKETIEQAFNIECGIIGDGHCDTSKQITVATIWSAAAAFNETCKMVDSDTTQDNAAKNRSLDKEKVRQLVQEAKLFIVDECQFAASQTIQFLHKISVNARYRFLLSGTPWRDDNADILIEAVGGPKIYDLDATKLIRMGYLVPPEIHFVNMPSIQKVGKNYSQVYDNFVVNNDEANKRLKLSAFKLMDAGKSVLVLVTKRLHGEVLYELLDDGVRLDYLDGRNNSDDRMDAIQKMKDGDLDLLIASKIFDQGIDIPRLNALILAGSGKSSGRALQRIGRVIRPYEDKTSAIVVERYDNVKYLRQQSDARAEIYGSEPAFKVKMPWS